MLRKDEKVSTPLGHGVVRFVRMKPPTYSEVEAASVFLDARSQDPGYSGTMFAAEDIRRRDEESADGIHCSGDFE